MFVYILISLIAIIQNTITTSQGTQPTKVAIPLTYAFNYEASVIFQEITFPLQDVSDAFTANLFAQIDNVFGKKGLNLNANEIILLKKTYLYLIFLTKLDLVKNNPAFKTYQSDFAAYLQDNNSAMPHIPNATLVQSTGWKETIITTADIVNSDMWQLFCKAETADAYNFFFTALNIIHNVEQQTFNYIPHIETSFYDHDYTNLRTINELTRLKIILETTNKDFYLNQCSDWSTLSHSTAKDNSTQNNSTLQKQIVAFKQTSFYKSTHDIYHLLGIKKEKSSIISAQQLLSPKQFTSPIKEQIWCFFMINEVLTMFYGLMTPEKLEDVLTYCSQSSIAPTIFPYTPDDYVYFEELLAIKCKTENNHTKSVHPSPPVHKVEESHVPIALQNALHKAKQSLSQNVKTQCFFCFLTDAFHAIEHAAEDVGNAVEQGAEDVGNAVKNAAIAAAHATAGIAEGVFGAGVGFLGNITDIESIKEFGSSVQKEAIDNLQTSAQDMQTSINDLTDGIKEGISAEAEIYGDLISVIADDKKLGEDFQTSYNQVLGALVNVAQKYTTLVTQNYENIALSSVRFSDEFANLVASATGALYSDNWDAVGQNAEELLNGTIKSIIQSFSNLLSDAKNLLGAVMQGVGAIMNTLTTVFIDITREVTFMITTAANLSANILTGQLSGQDFESALKDAQQTRNAVTNKLEAHRSTITQVLGVAIAVGFTVGTEIASGGAATGVDAAIDAELIGGDIVASASEASAEAAEATTEGAEAEAEEASEETAESSETAKATNEEPKNADEAQDETPDKAQDDTNNWKETLKNGLKITSKAFGNILNIVFGSFSILSGTNSDAQNAIREEQQAERLINFWTFINDNKISIIQSQEACLQELKSKQQAAIGNQMLSLAFIKNITYAVVNNLTKQLSATLSKSYIIPLLTPDSNNLLQANIGTSWGIVSPYLDLYPTQGFSSVTTGRPLFPFAQEVAQTPYGTGELTSSTKNTQPAAGSSKRDGQKLWFNQKVVALDNVSADNVAKKPTDPLHVTITMEIIYMVNASFYTGLYLGGNYYDYTSPQYLAELRKSNNFDIDAAHLAKMVVLFRDSAKAPLQLGIYEHEGKNWILREPLPSSMQLDRSHRYTIDARLNEDSLSVAITADNNTATSYTKTIRVTKLDNQRAYGVISSGAAIQWNQTTPQPHIQIKLPIFDKITEISREKKSKIARAKAINPKFGSIKLQTIAPQAIMLGQYLYTTVDTNLQKLVPINGTDYVVFATNQNGTIKDIGSIPPISVQKKKNSTVLVSVITGNAYDEDGNIVAHCANLWETYEKQFGPFSDKIANYITITQTKIASALKYISFGGFNLDIMSTTALQDLQYIYSCSQTMIGTDSAGAAIPDYLITANIVNNEISNSIGMAPTSANANGLVSLVTGNLYAKTTTITAGTAPVAVNQGYYELDAYTAKVGTINSADLAKIRSAQQAYTAYQAAQNAKVATAKNPPITVITTSLTNDSSLNSGTSLGQGPVVDISSGPPSTSSISALQQNAAGSAGVQLGTPSGSVVSLGNGP